jgi:hypothetical protein
MRFLSMIRVDERAAQAPSEQLMQDMGKLMDEMTREGVLVRTAGLRPTAEAILEAPSMQVAIEATERFLRVHGDAREIECEVRQLDGPEFGESTADSATPGCVARIQESVGRPF